MSDTIKQELCWRAATSAGRQRWPDPSDDALSPEQKQFFKSPSMPWTFPTTCFLARQRARDLTCAGQRLRGRDSANQLASKTKLTPSILLFQEELLPKMHASLTGFQSLPQTHFLERHKLWDAYPEQKECHSSPLENHQSLKVNASQKLHDCKFLSNTKLKTTSEMQITQQPTQDDLCHAIFFMQIN